MVDFGRGADVYILGVYLYCTNGMGLRGYYWPLLCLWECIVQMGWVLEDSIGSCCKLETYGSFGTVLGVGGFSRELALPTTESAKLFSVLQYGLVFGLALVHMSTGQMIRRVLDSPGQSDGRDEYL
jgi:hypothetical protein